MYVTPSLLDSWCFIALHGISTGHRRIMSGVPLCIATDARTDSTLLWFDHKEVPGVGDKMASPKLLCTIIYPIPSYTSHCYMRAGRLSARLERLPQSLVLHIFFDNRRFPLSLFRNSTPHKIVVGHHVPSRPFTVFSKYVCICHG